jgi:hypothetical protein
MSVADRWSVQASGANKRKIPLPIAPPLVIENKSEAA